MLEKLGQEKNYLSSIIFVMVLVGYPIFSGITIALGIESNALSIMYRLIVLTAAIALLLKSCLRYRLKINLGIFIGSSFLFYYVARMFLEWIFNSAGVKIDWLDFWSFLILVCLVPALPYAWGENIPNSSFTPFAIIVLGIIGLVFNFYFIFRVGDSSLGDQLFSGRVESERLNPIAYGHLGVSTVLMSLWMILLKKNINILAIFGFFFGILGVAASGSRGPILSLMVCTVLIFLKLKLRVTKFTVMFFVIFLIASLTFGFFMDFDDIYIFNRIEISMFEDETRARFFADAYHAFLENIFIGVGYPFESYPHNIVLEAFMSSGVVGGVLMVFSLSIGVISSFKVLKDQNFSWVSLLFIQYLLFSMVSSSIYYSNILWMLLVCVLTVSVNKHFRK